jgi:hypothetical protein
MIPDTATRVASNTDERVNREIRNRTRMNIERYRSASPMAIERRLRELDAEWNIERTLEANAATLAFIGTALGALVDRRWLILPAVVTGFLLQHAIQGWCPPVPVFRSLGYRTPREIETERAALKALRGDFREVDAGYAPSRVLEMAEA